MGRSGCCRYTTRSYSLDGETNWVANYFAGSKGVPTHPTTACCFDSFGNIYIGGPTTRSSTNPNVTWSLVSYDPEGQLRWKQDIFNQALGPGGANAPYLSNSQIQALINGGVRSVMDLCCTADDRIFCLCSGQFVDGFHFDQNVDGGNDIAGAVYNVDGTIATSPTVIPSFTINEVAVTTDGENSVFLVPYADASSIGSRSFTPVFQVFPDDTYIADLGVSAMYVGDPFAPINQYPTIAVNPKYLPMGPIGGNVGSNSYIWGYWGCEFLHPSTCRVNTLAATTDGGQIYIGGNNLCYSAGNLGQRGGLIRLIPGVGGKIHSVGEPNDVDNAVWGLPFTIGKLAIVPGGVLGNPSSSIYFFDEADGSKVWHHLHEAVSDIAVFGDTIVTTGNYASRAGEQSFV